MFSVEPDTAMIDLWWSQFGGTGEGITNAVLMHMGWRDKQHAHRVLCNTGFQIQQGWVVATTSGCILTIAPTGSYPIDQILLVIPINQLAMIDLKVFITHLLDGGIDWSKISSRLIK